MRPFVKRLVDIADAEWRFFGQQTRALDGRYVRLGRSEHEDGFWERVRTYWREGVDPRSPHDGRNRDIAWSAAFVSYLMRKAGAGEAFPYSMRHSTYIMAAIRATRRRRDDAPLIGYRIAERPPQVGDLVGYARESGIDFDTGRTKFASHTDVVVDVRPREIHVIGGNVSNSVTKKILKATSDGLLADTSYPWFVVIANRMELVEAEPMLVAGMD